MSDTGFDIERTRVDLRELLSDYWVGVVENPKQKTEAQLKASELLAKYILGEGRTSIQRRQGPPKPTTAEILKFAAELEDRLTHDEAESDGDS